MGKARAIILVSVAAIVLCAAVLTIFVLTPIDDRHYGRIVTWASKHFAGLEVTMGGPFLVALSSEPFITASKIRIRDVSRPAADTTVEIGRLEMKVAILPLLSRAILIRHLLIDGATVSIVHRKTARPGASKFDKRPSHLFIPVFESVSLRNVHLTVADENATELVRLVLEDYSLKDDGHGGPLYVEGQGALNAREFQIKGQLGSVADMLKGNEPYPVDLRANTAGLAVAVSGTIDDPMHGQGLNVRVVAEAGDMASLLRIFKADFPNLGQLSLDAKIVGDASSPGLADIELTVSRASDFNMTAKGAIENMLTGKGTSLKVSGSCTSTDILQMLLPEGLPEIHRLKGEGRIRDGDGVYVVEALKLTGSNEQGTSMKTEGTMGFSRAIGKVPAFRELDLLCQLSSPTTASAKFPAVDFLPELGAMSATGRVRLSEDLLWFEDLAVRSTHTQGLQVETAGAVQVPLDEAKDTSVEIDLQARVTAPNMGAAKPLLGKEYLSSSGPLLGRGRITGTSEVLSIEDLSITLGESGPVRGKWQGRIGHIPLSSEELPSDVDIVGSIDAADASALATLAAISLPNVGPLKTTFRFVEQEGVYRFKDIQLSMGSQDSLWLKGAGSVDMAVKGGAISLRGLDAEVTASAPNLAAIPRAKELELPGLKPLALKARIIDRDGRLGILDIESFELDAGTEKDAFLQIRGQASGVRGGEQKVVEASFKTASKPWVMKLLKDSAPENYELAGKFRVTGTPKTIRLEELEVGTTGPKRLYLEADGTVKEMEGTHEIEGRIASGASHASVLTSFLGIELPPFAPPILDGKIAGNLKKASFEGAIRFGDSRFKTTLHHAWTKQRPHIVAKIVATTVNLADLGFYAEKVEDTLPGSNSKPVPDRRLFGDAPLSFRALKAIDLSAGIDVDRLRGEGFLLEKLKVDVSLDGGKLQIAPAKVTYKNGSASIDFTADTLGPEARMALKVTAEDVDIGTLLSYLHERPLLSGQLNLVVDLKSTGSTPRELAGALGGEFGVAIEKGKIARIVEFMGADAVDFLYAIRTKAKYKDLHCVALRFVFEDGIGQSEVIYLETPDMYARGRGTIDLHSETMEIVLQPKPKKGLRGTTSALTIKGSIVDPQVRKLPFREAAKLYGEIFMPMVFLPARGLGYLWYLIKKDQQEESPCLHVIPGGNDSDEAR
jgi:uncharacterized protein involved in outer membrane biogenesis